jgi:dipeptidase
MVVFVGRAAVLVAAGLIRESAACTTIVVGKAASADGSVMVTHSNDMETNPDARLCWVPSKEHLPNSTRDVYFDKEDFPRYIGYDRGSCYEPSPGQVPDVPIGAIPQVARTYAFFESQYGIVNEHGVGIGESTCSGMFGANPAGHGGKAMMSIDELSRIAMERTSTSRSAVQTMGDLAVQYGFYGTNSFEGSSEALLVSDPDEAFIFHVLPDPTGTSAIWAAQRVPDDHVGVLANMFTIRAIDFTDQVNFLFSDSVRSVAKDKGWWKVGEPLDFTAIYSDGEYAHKYYSGRRMWGAYGLFGVQLPDNYTNLQYEGYPTTAKPTNPIGVQDLFKAHRFYYQGTKYDMTKGLAAGPWGDPDRWTTGEAGEKVTGNWERSIGIFRTDHTHVVQSRRGGHGSVVWYAPHASAGSVFAPIPARGRSVPPSYRIADPNMLNRNSAYWAHKYIFNVAKIKYKYAMQDVAALQTELESDGLALVASLDAQGVLDAGRLDEAYRLHADRVLQGFWALADTIIERYADGYLDDKTSIGYPDWWLDSVGYKNGPPAVPSNELQAETAVPSCDDTSMAQCLAACPRSGLAACAGRCVGPCHEAARADANIVV